ncbi:hypothetical protein SAY86_028961 [Trapa natans]|uniref:Uncharacterized protein n=1 Tax=Trapa natans TaxID=22666 RepID=A0AAN7M0J8_TRANT|nr:hypothetical protein SAY86_028961 [Trapa natans]
MEREADADGAYHLPPKQNFNEQGLGRDSTEDNMLTRVFVVSEVGAQFVAAEAKPPSGIEPPIDEEADFSVRDLPSDCGVSGTALAALEELDSMILGENNEDAERFKRFGVEALDKVDVHCSSVPEDDFGCTIDHDQNPNYSSIIDDEGAQLYEGPERIDIDAINDSVDLHNTAIGNDTEFLNVDDDEVNEHPSDDAEYSQTLDNSGESSRTRAVAKYLKTLFHLDKASRMFFESLDRIVGPSQLNSDRCRVL